jgi:hypothetical protein
MFKPKKVIKHYEAPSDLSKQRAGILDNFDFKTTAMIMSMPCHPIWDDECNKIIGYEPWKMFSKNGFKLYNEGELRYMAAKLLDRVIESAKAGEDYYCIGTGPFKAIYRYGILELDFVVTDWSKD